MQNLPFRIYLFALSRSYSFTMFHILLCNAAKTLTKKLHGDHVWKTFFKFCDQILDWIQIWTLTWPFQNINHYYF